MAKVLCVLYDDPVDGYPTSYARDNIQSNTPVQGNLDPLVLVGGDPRTFE